MLWGLEMFETMPMRKIAEFWNNRPCNINHSNAPIGSKQYFEEVQKRKYFVEPHISEFADFKKWNGKKVLEIGCGIGTDSLMFAMHGADVTVVDFSQRSIDIAKKRAEVFNFKNIRFYYGNAEKLSEFLPVEKYDLIYSFGVIHHTPNPKKVLLEIKKYMTKDSVLKIMVYHKFSWKVFGIILKNIGRPINESIARYSEAQTGCPVTYTYTKKETKKLLSGYEITNMFVDHIFPYNVKKYKKYIYKKLWYFKWMPKPFFRFIEKRLGWHLCITAKPVKVY